MSKTNFQIILNKDPTKGGICSAAENAKHRGSLEGHCQWYPRLQVISHLLLLTMIFMISYIDCQLYPRLQTTGYILILLHLIIMWSLYEYISNTHTPAGAKTNYMIQKSLQQSMSLLVGLNYLSSLYFSPFTFRLCHQSFWKKIWQ